MLAEDADELADVQEDEPPWSPLALCEAFAYKRGWTVGRFGRPDAYRAALAILRDALEGTSATLYWLPADIGESREL